MHSRALYPALYSIKSDKYCNSLLLSFIFSSLASAGLYRRPRVHKKTTRQKLGGGRRILTRPHRTSAGGSDHAIRQSTGTETS